MSEGKKYYEKYKKLSFNNPVHKRIRWVRNKINWTPIAAIRATAIPSSTYHRIESGYRTLIYEYILSIAVTFDEEWQRKFLMTKPIYDRDEVDAITVEWLMFGANFTLDRQKSLMENVQEDFRNKELQHAYDNVNLNKGFEE